jgi:hypothetical protein
MLYGELPVTNCIRALRIMQLRKQLLDHGFGASFPDKGFYSITVEHPISWSYYSYHSIMCDTHVVARIVHSYEGLHICLHMASDNTEGLQGYRVHWTVAYD